MAETIQSWRLLEDGITEPFLHFAVEETLLRRVAEGRSEPTLRLRRAVPGVWIGVYQDAAEDVNLEYCRERKLPIVRRPNPGGAVYQDQGTFCYSAFFPKKPVLEHLGIRETRDLYTVMGKVVTAMVRPLGIFAEAAPVNDVVVGGRKIYGSAQIELGDAVVHSGTFLVQADIEAMEAALKPSKLKFADKGFHSVRARVLNLSEAAGRPVAVSEVMSLLVEEFTAQLRVDLIPGGLTPEERREADALYREKYSLEEWTFPRRKPLATTLATKARSGVVIMDLGLEGDRIESIEIRGDFLVERQENLSSYLKDIRGLTVDEALRTLRERPLPGDVKDALARLIKEGAERRMPKEAMTP